MNKMKYSKRWLAALCLTAVLSMTAACGDNAAQNTAVENTINDTEVNEEETDNVSDMGGDEAGTEAAINDETASDNTENGAVNETSANDEDQYKAEIDKLLSTDAVLPAETELLAQMAACVTFSRILDEEGVVFSKMDSYKQGALRTQILKEVLSSENAFSGAITITRADDKYDADMLIPVDEAIAFFKDVFGAEDFTKGDHFERVEDGYILWSYGDGDPWERIEHMQFFSDDNYYLLTGPSFYEDNSGSTKFMGYADILFEKNADSRYGVTLTYGRYRNEKIKVSSVEATSELAAASGKNYSAGNLIDGDYSTAWVEGVQGVGVGESFTLHLDKSQPVYGVQICNGYTENYDLYTKNGMLASVKVDFGNGKVIEDNVYGYGCENADTDYLAELNLNRIELDEPVVTDKITITITSASVGTKYDDTCVSEVVVY